MQALINHCRTYSLPLLGHLVEQIHMPGGTRGQSTIQVEGHALKDALCASIELMDQARHRPKLNPGRGISAPAEQFVHPPYHPLQGHQLVLDQVLQGQNGILGHFHLPQNAGPHLRISVLQRHQVHHQAPWHNLVQCCPGAEELLWRQPLHRQVNV